MASNNSKLPPFEVAKESKANWIPAQELYFIDMMVDKIVRRGDNKGCGTFSKAEWFDIRKKFYNRWGLKFDLKAFKNKTNTLKERIKEFKKLVEGTTTIGLVWDPVLGSVIASDSWWDEYLKTNLKAKRFHIQGCPEYEKLATIFGDTISTGHLQTSTNHDFKSDAEDGGNTDLFESPPSMAVLSTPMEGTSTDDQDKNESNQCGRRESLTSEISELLHRIADAPKFKAEMTKKYYTISECIGILDAMGPEVEERTYMRAIKLLQEKGWREAFICMSGHRRKGWLRSIEAGDI